MTDVLALIPARGGSKGIPRKNLLQLAGSPLIAYSIRQALALPEITRVVVSTEDEEIAQVAEQYGAEVPFLRPPQFATDTATDFDVFLHALQTFAGQGYHPELVVQLRPTTPVRKLETIREGILLMLQSPEADSLKSVSEADPSPYKMWRVESGGLVPLMEIPGLPEAHSMPRQILPTVYAANGYLDIIRPRTILELGSMVGQRVVPLIIRETTYDLDHPAQLSELEKALASMQGETKRESGAAWRQANTLRPADASDSQEADAWADVENGN